MQTGKKQKKQKPVLEEQKSCDKIGYQHRYQAMDALKGLTRDKKRSMRMYFCNGCQLYHLTSNQVKSKKRKPVKEKYPWKLLFRKKPDE